MIYELSGKWQLDTLMIPLLLDLVCGFASAEVQVCPKFFEYG
jgi:hypothetical protein